MKDKREWLEMHPDGDVVGTIEAFSDIAVGWRRVGDLTICSDPACWDKFTADVTAFSGEDNAKDVSDRSPFVTDEIEDARYAYYCIVFGLSLSCWECGRAVLLPCDCDQDGTWIPVQ